MKETMSRIEQLRTWAEDAVIPPAKISRVDRMRAGHWRVKVECVKINKVIIEGWAPWQDIAWVDFPAKSSVEDLVIKASQRLLAVDPAQEKPLHSIDKLEIAIHYFCSGLPHPFANSPVGKRDIDRLVHDGILTATSEYIEETVEGVYYITRKGIAWIEAILSVPYPERE